MSIKNIRLEVMKTLEPKVQGYIDKFLIPVEKIWQPTDLLPDPHNEDFFEEILQIREEAKELSYDFWIVLVGDTVTEEALPTYESWLMDVEGVGQKDEDSAWAKWLRMWTGEENRHGDALNKYLYLSGRVDMREVEVTTHHLLNDGFDNGCGHDPYKNFIFTSFQELATNISHKRVGQLAMKKGNKLLGKMCSIIAGDEMRHHLAYCAFVEAIFEYDPSEMMLAYRDMMKMRISMPAFCIRESGEKVGSAFVDFSNAAQRLGVYTSLDYADIIGKLNKKWDIENVSNLNDQAKRARDYLVTLPDRFARLADRVKVPKDSTVFKWVNPNGMMLSH